LRQCLGDLVILTPGYAFRLQSADGFPCQTTAIDAEQTLVRGDQHPGVHHREIIHITTAYVQKPGDVIQLGYQAAVSSRRLTLLAQAAEFVATALTGIFE